MSFDPEKPYNELPPLPPVADIETKSILKGCITARAELARLQEAARAIPNEAILVNSIPLLEAKDSSEIENIVTTADKLFIQAQLNEENADPATKEALRYRSALWRGVQSLKTRPLSTSTAIEICREIRGYEIDVRATPGTALVNDRTGSRVYTPPEGEALLRKMLANWENFIHSSHDLDPLIIMAVQHYQFEAIHPFTDGNGRTGRILNILLLISKDLLTLPILYMSGAIIRHKQSYYETLLDVTQTGKWDNWIAFMLLVLKISAVSTRTRIITIQNIILLTKILLKTKAAKIYSRDLLDVLFLHPYCRISTLVNHGIAQRQTASAYLLQLCDLGLLESIKVGREKVFLNRPLFDLLKLRDEELESKSDLILARLESL
jgi:Fic family protein